MFYKEYPQIRYYEQLKYLLILYCAFHNTLLLALYNSLLFPLFCFIITYFLHKEKSTLSVFRKCRLFILVEQARVELASYRIAKRLSTRLCRNYLTICPSATERTYRQKSKFRRPADFKAKRPFPASNDARSLPTGKRCGRTA